MYSQPHPLQVHSANKGKSFSCARLVWGAVLEPNFYLGLNFYGDGDSVVLDWKKAGGIRNIPTLAAVVSGP